MPLKEYNRRRVFAKVSKSECTAKKRYLIIDPQRHMQFGIIFSSRILSFFRGIFPGKFFITSVSLSIQAEALNVCIVNMCNF